MDIRESLVDRTKFIRNFYDTAAAQFDKIMLKIDEGEAPFEPPYSEDPEPPFLSEWLKADTGLNILGRTCVSMLSASLKLYFQTWEKQLSVTWEEGERKKAFKKGFLKGYQKCFGGILNLSWDDCPADLNTLEQVILARNKDQHPDSIGQIDVKHGLSDLEKYPRPFFAHEIEIRIAQPKFFKRFPFTRPSIRVPRRELFVSIGEAEIIANWLEPKLLGKQRGK